MNNTQLRHFLLVYQLQSIGKAAEKAGVNQSAISKSLQKLEAYLQLKLFERHTRKLIATNAAKQLYKHANQCVCAEDDLLEQAQLLSHGSKGTLNIGCGPLAHAELVNPLIGQLITSNSSLRIQAKTAAFESLRQDLDQHVYHCLLYDVGNLEQLEDPSEYEVISLLKKPLYFVARANHAVHKCLNFAEILHDLSMFKIMLPPIPPRYLNELSGNIKQFILRSDKPDFETTDLQQAVKIAQNHDLITVACGDIQADGSVGNSGLMPINTPFIHTAEIGLWRLRSRLMTPQLSQLITHLKQLNA